MQFYSNCVKQSAEKNEVPLLMSPKYSPGVMVWGGISMRGATELAFIKGTVNSLVYQDIINDYCIDTMNTLYPDGWELQQDNAPCHTSKSTLAHFESLGLKVLKWPANSPDLNPIENLWSIIKRRLRAIKRTTIADWREKIKEIWESVDHELLSVLVESMPRRIEACIAAKGGHTKY